MRVDRYVVFAAVLVLLISTTTSVRAEEEDAEEKKKNSTQEPEGEDETPRIPPMKIEEDIACSACDVVVDRIYNKILNVTAEQKKLPLKERKDIASNILRETCFPTRGMKIEGPGGSRKFVAAKYERSDDEETDVEAEKEWYMGLDVGPEDELLFKACHFMMGTEGWKLRSRIAGFYKETTRYSLRKRLCINSLDLCQPPRPSKLKRHEKCLMSAFNALGREDWTTALDKIDCAKDFSNSASSSSSKKKKKKKKKSKKKKSEDAASE
eukprot:g51.t1